MKQDNKNEITIDLKKLFYMLKGKAALIIAVAIVFALAGYFFAAMFVTPVYSASADMMVNNYQVSNEVSISNSDVTASSSLANTYSVILKSHTMLQKVINELGLDFSYDEICKKVSISAIEDTQIIRITVLDENPETAIRIANKIADLAPNMIKNTITAGSIKLVDAAWSSDAPAAPNKAKYAASFGLAAFVLCIIIVILKEALNDTVVSPEDAKKVFSAPLLGVIPIENEDAKKNKGHPNKSASVTKSKSFPYIEAYKSLRTNLDYIASDESRQMKVIMITSCNPSEGKTTVSINLANSLAEIGKRVVIVDCDLRKGTLQRYLRVPWHAPSIPEYMSGRCGINEIVLHSDSASIDVVICGALPENPAEMISNVRFGELLHKLSQVYDYVICDAAPVNAVADAIVLSRYVDGTIMVMGQNRVTKEAAEYAKEQLEHSGAPVIGTILNWFDVSKAGKESQKNYGYYESYRNIESKSGSRTAAAASSKSKKS